MRIFDSEMITIGEYAFSTNDLLGQGAFGHVYKGKHRFVSDSDINLVQLWHRVYLEAISTRFLPIKPLFCRKILMWL